MEATSPQMNELCKPLYLLFFAYNNMAEAHSIAQLGGKVCTVRKYIRNPLFSNKNKEVSSCGFEFLVPLFAYLTPFIYV